MENTQIPVMSSAVYSATHSSTKLTNYGCMGVHLIVDVTSVPATGVITPKIEAFDIASQSYYAVLVGSEISTIGKTILKIFPGIAAAQNGSANDVLPSAWRVTVTHSLATNFTYSVGANLIG